MTDFEETDGLPTTVVERMREAGVSVQYRNAGAVRLETLPIYEPRLEARSEDGDNGVTHEIRGYPSVFDYEYPIAGGPDAGGFTEIIERTAFTRTLNAKPDVRFLVNHEGLPLARSTSGTLTLATDDDGLLMRADLDMVNPRAAEVYSAVKRGDMTEMSFAFRLPVKGAIWNQAYTVRRIREVSLNRGDVTICPFGASDATIAIARSSDDVIEEHRLSVEFARAFAMSARRS